MRAAESYLSFILFFLSFLFFLFFSFPSIFPFVRSLEFTIITGGLRPLLFFSLKAVRGRGENRLDRKHKTPPPTRKNNSNKNTEQECS